MERTRAIGGLITLAFLVLLIALAPQSLGTSVDFERKTKGLVAPAVYMAPTAKLVAAQHVRPSCTEIQSLIIEHCGKLALTTRETAFVLAMCEVESGFNPRAANKKSSARGLFQFVTATRKELARRAGVCADDPFCIALQLACLTEQLKETFPIAERKAGGRESDAFFAWAYAYHHDGPSFRYGGYALAQERLLPRLDYYESMVSDE